MARSVRRSFRNSKNLRLSKKRVALNKAAIEGRGGGRNKNRRMLRSRSKSRSRKNVKRGGARRSRSRRSRQRGGELKSKTKEELRAELCEEVNVNGTPERRIVAEATRCKGVKPHSSPLVDALVAKWPKMPNQPQIHGVKNRSFPHPDLLKLLTKLSECLFPFKGMAGNMDVKIDINELNRILPQLRTLKEKLADFKAELKICLRSLGNLNKENINKIKEGITDEQKVEIIGILNLN